MVPEAAAGRAIEEEEAPVEVVHVVLEAAAGAIEEEEAAVVVVDVKDAAAGGGALRFDGAFVKFVFGAKGGRLLVACRVKPFLDATSKYCLDSSWILCRKDLSVADDQMVTI